MPACLSTHTHTRARTRTHAHARARTHTRARARARTRTHDAHSTRTRTPSKLLTTLDLLCIRIVLWLLYSFIAVAAFAKNNPFSFG